MGSRISPWLGEAGARVALATPARSGDLVLGFDVVPLVAIVIVVVDGLVRCQLRVERRYLCHSDLPIGMMGW